MPAAQVEPAEQAASAPPKARLVIEEPRLRDDALYKCDVTYVKGKCPSISLVRLQMMSLPSRALISQQQPASSNQLLAAASSPQPAMATDGQLLGPFNEQDFLQLACLVLGGRPAPKSVSWRRVDPAGRVTNLVSSRQVHRPAKDGQTSQLETLLNHQLSRADLGAKFECHVEHEALEMRNQVQVVNEPLAGLQLSGRDSTLDLHPALPPPDSLSMDHTQTKSLDSHVFVDLNVGVASVDLFMAKANRRNLSEPLRDGDLVELECVAYNARPAANISWFNGQERIEQLELGGVESGSRGQVRHKRLLQRHQVHPNTDGHTYDTHSFLSIKLTRYENRAQISCNASNGVAGSGGAEQVRSLELQVQHAPVVLMEPASGIQVDEVSLEQHYESSSSSSQQQVSIYCIYSANPNELAAGLTRWFKDGRPLELASDARLSESQTATGYPVLSIRQPTRHDAGTYECQLANALGVSERLAPGEQCRLEVNFRPTVKLRLLLLVAGSSRELDPSQELVEAGQSFALHCDVVEARPNKVEKFHWYRWELGGAHDSESGEPQPANLIGVTDSERFQVPVMKADSLAAAYACSAFNSLGPSHRSNHIELRLSHTPGPSHVRAVSDSNRRKSLLMLHQSPASQADPKHRPPASALDDAGSELVVAAGRELMLECLTWDAGQPAANSWLWFKDGQALETLPYNTQSPNSINSPSMHRLHSIGGGSGNVADNPISDLEESMTDNNNQPPNKQQLNYSQLNHGRYLFISNTQLSHRGNYSCSALNRMGPAASAGNQLQLSLAMAPSFVQSLAARTYWPEVKWAGKEKQVELICQVQCEPICQLEWLRNNEPLRLNRRQSSNSEAAHFLQVTHQLTHSLIDENPRLNLFKSVVSRLELTFGEPLLQGATIEQRRNYLSGLNYTCQSSGNPFGPPVSSSTRLMVQYPPEKLLISSHDKLSLVEGDVGPRLSCEAAGEPQPQYRWFFLRAPTDHLTPPASTMGAPTMGLSHGLNLEDRSLPTSATANSTSTYGAATLRGANDIQQASKELIELTGSPVGGPDTPHRASGSTLNLASQSMHRKQAGHYICEASNRLGRSRQSVFVNVLYKPTCATLHLYSLDSTLTPKAIGKSFDITKPSGATSNDEYSIVRETSEDYLDLRKLLVLAPLLNRWPLDLEAPFGESIFHAILKDSKGSHAKLLEEPSNFGTFRTSDALINRDPSVESSGSREPLVHIEKERPKQGVRKQDSWDKFNSLLLSFINSYSRKVSRLEEQNSIDTASSGRRKSWLASADNNKQPSRRSASQLNTQIEYEASDEDNRWPVISSNSSKNLLTFTCLAKDANPINNLTFTWSFGSLLLPEGSDAVNVNEDSLRVTPLASHSYDNYTIHVILVKRLDVQATFNPFQFSLVTLNVIVEPLLYHEDSGAASQRSDGRIDRAATGNKRTADKLPVEVAEMNWEEYIGQMLKCRISNQIGSSEVCHANINQPERSKSRELRSESEFANWKMPALATKSLLIIGITICCSLIVLATLFLVASPHLKQLLYNNSSKVSKTSSASGSRYTPPSHDTNTGSQSTSSQKSSVLGLLGGDSSIQESSDDDSSARVEPLSQPERLHKRSLANRMLELDDAATLASVGGGHFLRSQPRTQSGSAYDRPRDLRSGNEEQQQPANSSGAKKNTLQSRLNSFCRSKTPELTLEPISSAQSRALASSASSRFLESLKFKSLSKFKTDRITDRAHSYLASEDNSHSSQRNLHSKNLSNSETVTTGLNDSFRDAKDGLTQRGTPVSKFLSAGGGSPLNAHLQHHRSAHHPFKRAPSHLINRTEASHFLSSLQENSASPSSYLMQLNLRSLLDVPQSIASAAPAYSNLTYLDPSCVMEDHSSRQPHWTVDDNLYLSQVNPMLAARPTTTTRNLPKQPVFTVKSGPYSQYGSMVDSTSTIDNNNCYTHQNPDFYTSSNQPNDNRSTSSMTFRTSYQQVMNLRAADQQYHSLMGNRFSMPPIHAPPPPVGIQITSSYNNHQPHTTTTIDTHLDRMNDALTNGLLNQATDQHIAYANTLNRNSYLPIACCDGDQAMASASTTSKPVEHIYDLNAYATPEQTPLKKGTNTASNTNQSNGGANERLRVSELIQSFNSIAPE